MTNKVEPTQADREAAAEFFRSWPRVTVPDYLPAALADLLATHRLDAVRPLVEALEKIAGWEPEEYPFPPDWTEQIKACAECQSYAGHPIQRGICDTHRRPLWDREKHEAHQKIVRGYRAQMIARDALFARTALQGVKP